MKTKRDSAMVVKSEIAPSKVEEPISLYKRRHRGD